MRSIQLKQDYWNQLSNLFPLDHDDLEELLNGITLREVPSMTTLLSAGEIATKLFIVIRGCLREYYIKENGNEISFQFFVENQIVGSFESLTTGKPSRPYIGAIEDSIIGFLPMKTLEAFVNKCSPMKDYLLEYYMSRLVYYMNRCSSYILDNPEKRYVRFVEENPHLVARLPQQYIASYLGITPVSLSRIRSRLREKAARFRY